MKNCYKCGEQKPLSEFYKNKSNKDGFQKRCKPCDIGIAKERYQKDPQVAAKKRFTYKLKREYDISFEQYELMKESQNNTCGICKSPLQTSNEVHIDHCHSSGKVRGILCRWCNLGLGHFKDSVDNLKSAQKYLQKQAKKAPEK